jgi:uncharacterized protein (UPF0548 family)
MSRRRWFDAMLSSQATVCWIALVLLFVARSNAVEDVLRNMLQRKHPPSSSDSIWNRMRQQFLHPSKEDEETTKRRSNSGSRITRLFPTPERVTKWYAPSSSASSSNHRRSGIDTATLCNHRLAGRTNPMLHLKRNASTFFRSWRAIELRKTVGHGPDCYRACRDAALRWEFHASRHGVVAVRESSEDLDDPVSALCWGPGRRLITYTTLGAWYILNPVTVLYSIVDQPCPDLGGIYTATAFGTRPGHWLRGEERVTVSHRPHDNDQVDVEIVSYSRPGSLLGRGVFFALRPWQESFFRAQLVSLQRVAVANGSSEDVPRMLL